MKTWNPSPHYQKIARANQQYYAKTAHLYDQTETCATNVVLQRHLERDLDDVLRLIGKPYHAIQALDACGGSGNVSIKLLRRGVPTITCDISTEMLRICQDRCIAEDLPVRVVCAEIASFLEAAPRTFDLIVFSSALHHLEDIDGVLNLAIRSLKPGGVIFSTFDPSAHLPRYGHVITWLDYVWFKIFCQPTDVGAAVVRRLRRTLGRVSSREQADLADENLGYLAEYHVEHGIDDRALVERLRAQGVEIVRHEREAGARFALARAALRALGVATTFKMVLRVPA